MVLMGILLPVLSGTKASAKQLQQMSNIRQVGTTIDLYLNDWKETYPIADIRPAWYPLSVDEETARALGIGRNWTAALLDADLLTQQQLNTLYHDSHAFGTVAMHTDPNVMTPDTIPVWENHQNSAVKQSWAIYPALKGLVGVSFVPDGGNEDRLMPGHKLWNNGLPDGPKAPVLFADSSVIRLRYSEMRKPDPAPIDVWGSGMMYTWDGIRGRDR